MSDSTSSAFSSPSFWMSLMLGVGSIALAARQDVAPPSGSGARMYARFGGSGTRGLAARERILKRENPFGSPEGIRRDDSPAARRERRAERSGRRSEWEDDGGWDGGME